MNARPNLASVAVDGVERNRRTIRTQFDGFVAHDLAAIMDTFADDCVYDEYRGAEAHGRRFAGKPALRDAFAAIFARTPDCTFEDPVIVAEADHVIAKWTFVVSTRDRTPFAIEGIDLFTLREGKVVTKTSWLKARRPPLRLILRELARRALHRGA
jgi:ketosteroid isomerase-like protein